MGEKSMKTQDLIALLASDTLQPHPPARQQLVNPLMVSALVSGVLLVLVFGINPKMDQMAVHPAFLTKMLWLGSLMGFSLYGLFRLARPGVTGGHMGIGLGLSMLAMIGLGWMQYLQADTDARMSHWMGSSWDVCGISITGLSLPVLGALLWGLRQLAPTRPALTGAVAGVLSGSLAAAIYSLHCPETSFVFYAIWYTAGMIMSTILGAVSGARLLRW
jgi:hypothetical protein